jgi:hypothetical protein
VSLLQVFREKWLQLPCEKGFLPVFHETLHLLDVVLHFLDEVVYLDNILHGLVDEWVNGLRVPFELFNTLLEGGVHCLNSI